MSLLNTIFKKEKDKDDSVVIADNKDTQKSKKNTSSKTQEVSEGEVVKKIEVVKGGKIAKESKVAKVSKEDTKDAYKVLISPLVSEKATRGGSIGQYVFRVGIRANKREIKKSIFVVYGIMPVSVNTVQSLGKNVRSGKNRGKRKDWKKAIVTLPKGKTIQIYEGI